MVLEVTVSPSMLHFISYVHNKEGSGLFYLKILHINLIFLVYLVKRHIFTSLIPLKDKLTDRQTALGETSFFFLPQKISSWLTRCSLSLTLLLCRPLLKDKIYFIKALFIWSILKPELKTYLFVCLWILLNKSGILGGSVLLRLVDLLIACMQQAQVGNSRYWAGRRGKKQMYGSAITETWKVLPYPVIFLLL